MEKGFAEYLGASMGLMQAMGATQDFAGMYSDASAGPPEIYNGVEIKSYILPNISTSFSLNFRPEWKLLPQNSGISTMLSTVEKCSTQWQVTPNRSKTP